MGEGASRDVVPVAPGPGALRQVALGRQRLETGRDERALAHFAAAYDRDPSAALLDWGLWPGPGALEERMLERSAQWRAAPADTPAGRLSALRTKAHIHRWLQDEGVPVPPRLATAPNIGALDFAALPARYIIKPVDASSSRGVFRVDGDEIRTLASWRRLRGGSVAERIRRRYEEIGLSGQEVIVEQAMRDVTDPALEIPRDVKIFAVRGQVCFVQMLDRNGKKARRGLATLTRDWALLPQSSSWPPLAPGPKPAGFDEAVALTERLSRKVPLLVRWDFFLTPDGPVLCEVTKYPNAGKSFRPWMERAVYQLVALDALAPGTSG
ncbi:hypothetical protein OG2516_01366 [Oceanicola granulosus HTCC2516]|uniref:ATP-grasp domain-containing protein n=1 Tax=Oceanicola granulosus (strain ATCC BAA-861 / DSM 15982 / KCTC 12143 / HTCC2516) TaxID=314256 RepID=Q2CG16_OCEGH|nr:hypothetical protein OG2516_01366 [Oceanicola granulosus HTCC2516]